MSTWAEGGLYRWTVGGTIDLFQVVIAETDYMKQSHTGRRPRGGGGVRLGTDSDPLSADRLLDDLDRSGRESVDTHHVECVLEPEQHYRDLRQTRGHAAERCERPTACRGPYSSGPPLNIKEPRTVRTVTWASYAVRRPRLQGGSRA